MYSTGESRSLPAINSKRARQVRKKFSKRIKSPFFNDSTTCAAAEDKKELKSDSLCNLNSGVSLRLNHIFFKQPCIELAKNLLGKILVRKLTSGEILKGIIVETESYLGVIDRASHSYNGKRTDRNEAMFLCPGTAYVYSIYGMYYCFNVSSLEDGSAVLLRAIEPLEGTSTMQEFRSKKQKVPSEIKLKDLCNGPSKLCQAFKIEKDLFNKIDLCSSSELWLEEGGEIDVSSVISCKRIGIDSYGEEWANKPLRFYVKGNSCVSRRCKAAKKAQEELH